MVFILFYGGCVLADRSPAIITPKGAESPDSGRIGVIGALVFFSTSTDRLRPFRINFNLPGRPSSALIHRDVSEYSEVADSVHART